MPNKRFNKYPFEIEEPKETEKNFLKSLNLDKDYVHVGPKKYMAPAKITTVGLDLLNFEARKDDIWLFGYPRSGTTLTQEILWLIQNDLDFEGASKKIMDHRFPVIDHPLFLDSSMWSAVCEKTNASEDIKSIAKEYVKPHYQKLEEISGKRFIKSHLPISLSTPSVFEVGCKVVYCARHPKDVIVSNMHILKLFQPEIWENISFPDFWKLFKNNLVHNTPWFEHVKEGWARRNDKNFLFLFYEDTNKNKRDTILKIAKFLDKKLTEQDIQKLEDHLSIDKFRKNKSVNNDHFLDLGMATQNKEHQFIRKGKVGGWKEYFTPELNAEADKWIEQNLKNSDLVLPNI